MLGLSATPVWKRLLTRVGLDFLAIGFFVMVLATLMLAYGGRLHFAEGSVIWPTLILLVIVLTSFLGRAHRLLSGDAEVRREVIRRALSSIRDWSPLIILVLVYQNLRGLTGLIRPDAIDMSLYQLDIAIFGVEPTIWAQQFASPWLTDWFAFSYTLYFIIPLVLATTLYGLREREDFKELVVGVLLVQYTGFLLYITFPAGPPRFAIPELFDPPKLTGIFGFYDMTQRAFDSVNPNPVKASFPSLHCALSCLALLYAWRFRKAVRGSWMFWVFLPLVVSLWCATVYLRHHWIVDCFAGFALATVVFSITPRLRRWHASLGASEPSVG
jgi:membrane-associated phospholipid phosphatase